MLCLSFFTSNNKNSTSGYASLIKNSIAKATSVYHLALDIQWIQEFGIRTCQTYAQVVSEAE